MRKRLLAALSVAVFLLNSLAAATPVSAHFTLGDNTPVSRFRKNDFDPHVPGPLAYVWPGAGLAAYTGTPNGFPPGYQTPFPGGNPSNQVPTIYQLEGRLSPFGAILASTDDHTNLGPLIFALNFSTPCAFLLWNDVDNHCKHIQGEPSPNTFCGPGVNYCANYTGVTIYIPPEFDLSTVESNPGLIDSTFGSTANDLVVTKADNLDPWGPGWWIVHIEGDIHWWPQHDYREWYYIRINNVIAPKIVGRYFFKVFLWDQFFNFVWPGMPRSLAINGFQCNPSPGVCVNGPDPSSPFQVPFSGPTNATVPVENWPVLLVKGDVDPGIVIGRIRYSSFNDSLYQKPIDLPGKVLAVGVTSAGRKLTGVAYFNQSAQGHYELEGLAPGTYDLYASAAGYPTQHIAKISVGAEGASQVDGYIQPGPVVRGQIFSKHQLADQPWPDAPRPVLVEIYNSADYIDENVVAYSPLNLTHPPYMAYDWNMSDKLPMPTPVAYPWSASFATWGTAPFRGSYYFDVFNHPFSLNDALTGFLECGGTVDQCGKPNGVGPAQFWWVDGAGDFTNGGGPSSFMFAFGAKGFFGVPTTMDGHVPQPLATWVNGLTPGRYWLRAWINGYTQTTQDGITIENYPFEVAGDWAGDIFTPMDLRVGSLIVKTVHFHDQTDTLQDCPINGCSRTPASGLSRGPRYLIAEVRDNQGKLAGMNFTLVNDCLIDPQEPNCSTKSDEVSSATVEVNGFGLMGPDIVGVKYSYFRYQGYRDYGLPAGTYSVYVYMRGYVQGTHETASLSLSGSPARISNHMYRGARLNITATSVDWEHPKVPMPWEFPGARFRIYVFNSNGNDVYYVGDPNFNAVGGDRGDDPGRQPTCFFYSLEAPFCPTGSPQTIDSNDTIGATFVVDEWDGFIGADSRGPDEVPFFNTMLLGGNFYPWWKGEGFLYSPGLYRLPAFQNFKASDALDSDVYTVFGFTYGYVQHNLISEYAQRGGFADIKLNLARGVNITLNIKFKREGIFTSTQFNMSMRVRVFDDAGNLVATASSIGPDNACIDPFCSELATSSGTDTVFGLGRFTGSNRNSLAGGPFDGLLDSGQTFGKFTHTGRKGNPTFGTYYVDPFAQSPSRGNGLLSIDGSSITADTFLWHGTWKVGPGGKPVTGWQAFDSDPDQNNVADFGTFQFNQNGWGLFEWRTSIPYGTDEVRVSIAGIYDPFGDPLDGFNAGVLHTRGWDLAKGGEKVDSMWYGIDGFSSTLPNSYTGGWTAEVDAWNEYPAYSSPGPHIIVTTSTTTLSQTITSSTTSFATTTSSNSQTTTSTTATTIGLTTTSTTTSTSVSMSTVLELAPPESNWYPPPEGLLEGDSYHLIPGDPVGPFGYTGKSLSSNGLGPYAQHLVFTVPNTHLGAEESVIFELDKLGYISGNVYSYIHGGELRTESWVAVQALDSSSNRTFTQWAWDSWYDMYLPAGDYTFTIYPWTPRGNQGYNASLTLLHISGGQSSQGVTFILQESTVPIPEFKATLIVALSALVASAYLLRRRRSHNPK